MKIKRVLLIALCSITTSIYAQDKVNQVNGKGNRHGLWRGVYEKSQRPRYEGTFEDGKEVGVFKYFDDTKKGDVIATRDFSANDGSVYVTFFDQKGNKVSEGRLDKNKKNIGKWIYYHKESKAIMSEENYVNGLIEGEVNVYYPDGKLATQTQYVKGKKNGVFKNYTNKGVLIEEISYVDDQFHGPVKFFEPNGNKVSEGLYEKGLKIGIWKYYEEGKLVKEVDEKAQRLLNRQF